jgi:hypothetical protein
MTCKQALDLIDIGPFADVSEGRRDALRRHASGCSTCAQALAASAALDVNLRHLPQPGPPSDFTAALMARIARIEPSPGGPGRARSRANAATWLAALAAGVLIVLRALVTNASGSGFHPGAPGTLPTTASAALALTVGLILYVTGLFGPIRRALRR